MEKDLFKQEQETLRKRRIAIAIILCIVMIVTIVVMMAVFPRYRVYTPTEASMPILEAKGTGMNGTNGGDGADGISGID